MSAAPWDLSGLEDAGRKKRFEVLLDWVGWLTEHYGLQRSIPSCWWRHPAMVEELNALETAWSAAYEGGAADKEAPLRWHEELARTRQRLLDWDRQGCAGGTHRDHRVAGRRVEDPEPAAWAHWHAEQRQLKRSLRPNDRASEVTRRATTPNSASTQAPFDDDVAISSADELFMKLIFPDGGGTGSRPEHLGEVDEEGGSPC